MPRDKRLYMTFPIDFHRHPKFRGLSPIAKWTFVEMNGEARLEENDGIFTAEDAEFIWPAEVLAELANSHPSRPLVVADDGRYVIRDYAEHQFTKADRDELSRKRAEAGALGAAKREANRKHLHSKPEQTDTEIGIDVRKEEEGYVSGDSLVSSAGAEAPDRPEIVSLLDLLDSLIKENGGKAPSRNKRNTDAMRLLIDRDGVRPDQIERAIRWCQADEFWRANILSASKLREKYDQLRLSATRGQANKPHMSKAAANAAEYRRLFGEHEGSVPAIDVGVSA